MDAKLKALKVVDLKHLLAVAAVAVPAKATKPDLIAKILANKSALDAYAQLYPPDDLLAPPEDVDWNADQPESPPTTTPAVVAVASPPKAIAPVAAPEPQAAPTPQVPQESTPVDDELEKRKKRAERFGIPLVQPREKKPRPTTAKSAAPSLDPKVLEQRAARFGLKNADPPTVTHPTNPKKRSAPQSQQVDPEEAERRRKRAERFGIPNKA